MNVAESVREIKAAHPERYCTNPRCLWRVETRNGRKPCPKHMSGAKDAVSAGNREDASPRVGDTENGEGITDPTATLTLEREERLQDHDPERCTHPNCRLAF